MKRVPTRVCILLIVVLKRGDKDSFISVMYLFHSPPGITCHLSDVSRSCRMTHGQQVVHLPHATYWTQVQFPQSNSSRFMLSPGVG